jgi:hypothetical protein
MTSSLRSKTMWLAAITVVVGGIQSASPFIPPQYTGLALAVVGVLTAVSRVLTNKPLSEK